PGGPRGQAYASAPPPLQRVGLIEGLKRLPTIGKISLGGCASLFVIVCCLFSLAVAASPNPSAASRTPTPGVAQATQPWKQSTQSVMPTSGPSATSTSDPSTTPTTTPSPGPSPSQQLRPLSLLRRRPGSLRHPHRHPNHRPNAEAVLCQSNGKRQS